MFKGGDDNPCSPLDHRPLCIVSCFAKVYSCITNKHLQQHLTTNDLLTDTQNGFRDGHSCINHFFLAVHNSQKVKVDKQTNVSLIH